MSVVLRYLLTDRCAGLAERRKALIPFHAYDGGRTPIDEHFVEAAHYVRDGGNVCRLHFTVSAEHMERCRDLAERAAAKYGPRFDVRYEVGFSIQKASTDALAVDTRGLPFRA